MPKRSSAQNGSTVHMRLYLLVGMLGTCLFSVLFLLALFEVHARFLDMLWLEQPTISAKHGAPTEPFPVGVDPARKSIVENPAAETYPVHHLAITESDRYPGNWIDRLLGRLAHSSLFQSLASPGSRILVVFAGERREEITGDFGDILGWDDTEREQFVALVTQAAPPLTEGKFIPGRYMVPSDAPPEAIAALLISTFERDIASRYTPAVSEKVPIETTLALASLLEREAYTYGDMRTISGVIWNRLFAGMPLQIDATLQYARGTTDPWSWWPRVQPNDKFIDSPFNTYANEGLPPAPIANPSLSAIVAALNPKKTACMYYFHDDDGILHCSKTYKTHVNLLKQLYGTGR